MLEKMKVQNNVRYTDLKFQILFGKHGAAWYRRLKIREDQRKDSREKSPDVAINMAFKTLDEIDTYGKNPVYIAILA